MIQAPASRSASPCTSCLSPKYQRRIWSVRHQSENVNYLFKMCNAFRTSLWTCTSASSGVITASHSARRGQRNSCWTQLLLTSYGWVSYSPLSTLYRQKKTKQTPFHSNDLRLFQVPDTFIVNSLYTYKHDTTKENEFIRILDNGEVLRSIRFALPFLSARQKFFSSKTCFI